MHNAKAIWDGHAEAAATVSWEVDFVSSPIVTGKATFEIESGENAVDVAKNLTAAWNSKKENVAFPATRQGVVVTFAPKNVDSEIVGMRFDVLGGAKDRLPATGTEVKVVDGLFVHRST